MNPGTASQLERKLRQLEPIDVVVALTWRLALAIDKLRALAKECAECGGKGETAERYEAHVMTHDPRLIDRPHAHRNRARVEYRGAIVEAVIRGAGHLWTKCAACADIRATILICEATGPAEGSKV